MSGCHCQYGYDPEDCDQGDPCQVWSEGRVKRTRKPHRCCECNDAIPPGSACCYASHLCDGEWETEYRCVSCSTLVELVAELNKACPQWGGLDDAAEAAGVSFSEWQEKARRLEVKE